MNWIMSLIEYHMTTQAHHGPHRCMGNDEMPSITREQLRSQIDISAYNRDQPDKPDVAGDVEAWLAKGNKITKIPNGVSGQTKFTGYKHK